MEFLLLGLGNVFTITNLFFLLLGTIIGIVMGALPGVGPALTIALLLPFTFGMPPEVTLILLGSAFSGSVFGGSIVAILLNTPGTAGNAATTFDGHELAKQGKAGQALGLAAASSAIGGIISILVLSFFAPPLARMSVHFGPAEQFMLGLLGLSVVALAADNNFIKGWISAGMGLLVSMIGLDLISGQERFTFGITYLTDGISFIPTMVGLFAISQVIILALSGGTISSGGNVKGGFLKGAVTALKYRITLLRSSIIGVLFGTVPALGVYAASFFAYLTEKRASKEPDKFGKGAPQGVVAPEAANNAVVGGSLVPTLALGIPGSSTAAVLLGGLMIAGIAPGYRLFTEQADMVGTFFVAMLIAQLAFFILGGLLARPLSKIVVIPNELLVPGIMLLGVAGAFTMRNSMADVIVCLIFGVVGYLFIKTKYPIVCFILGFILGPIIEKGFQRAILMSDGSYSIFVTRPGSLVLFLLVVVMFIIGTTNLLRSQRKNKNTTLDM
ncbi:hypothetical protein BTR23_25245 [Alkalihalophilus pseudofirmus]|nr:hypothetical protein BTR23_25245 [Alkalihalophilus pseudofirmus]